MQINNLILDPAANQAYKALAAAGGDVYLVGGAVRDLILNKSPKDFDLLVTGLPAEQVEQALATVPHSIVNHVGKNFGVFLFKFGGFETDIALPRAEASTGPGHKEFDISTDHTLDVTEDLKRRDFTANAMAVRLADKSMIDPYSGVADINAGVLSLVNPVAFQEDPLRIVRGVVANARHDLVPDEATAQSMRDNAPNLRFLPGERMQMELDKLLTGGNPAAALRWAEDNGILEHIFPEVSVSMGVEQHNEHHDYDVGNHLLNTLETMTSLSNDPDLRLAALLHDIGKPDSMWMDEDGQGHFYKSDEHPGSEDHEDLGATYAQAFMRRLHYPNDRINRVVAIIQHHMFANFTTAKGARKFLANCHGDVKLAFDLLTLRRADSAAHRAEAPNRDEWFDLEIQLLKEVIDNQEGTTVKDLQITGNDLKTLGVEPGPLMGKILKEYLLPLIVEDPDLNNREDLMRLVQEKLENGNTIE